MQAEDAAKKRMTPTEWMRQRMKGILDPAADFFIRLGLLFYYLGEGNVLACMLVFLATMGSVMVSYTKARAETLGFDCNVGVLTRLERYIVLAPALVFNLPWVALW